MKLIVVVVVMRAGEERKNLKSVSVWKNEAQLKISHSKKGHRIASLYDNQNYYYFKKLVKSIISIRIIPAALLCYVKP